MTKTLKECMDHLLAGGKVERARDTYRQNTLTTTRLLLEFLHEDTGKWQEVLSGYPIVGYTIIPLKPETLEIVGYTIIPLKPETLEIVEEPIRLTNGIGECYHAIPEDCYAALIRIAKAANALAWYEENGHVSDTNGHNKARAECKAALAAVKLVEE